MIYVTNIYMGLRCALKRYGIDVRLGSYRYESKVLMISNIQYKYDK